MKGKILPIEDFMYCINTDEYNFSEYEEFQIDIMKNKLSLISEPINMRETVDVRSRGASKTWDEMVKDLYLAALRIDTWFGFGRLRGYWFSTSEDQLDQPQEYFDYILNNSFLKYCIMKKNATKVIFKNYGKLKLSILTGKKSRSGRGDFITFDEEAQADEKFYNAALAVVSGSWLAMFSHISTPKKSTVFEDNHDKCKLKELKTGLRLVFKVPWWEVKFLAKNKEFYEEEKRSKPSWWYRQEYCGEFTYPRGAVFTDIITTDIPTWIRDFDETPLVSGIDWNPVNGHWLVGGRWIPSLNAFVVQHEIKLGIGYTHQLKYEIYEKIRPFFINKKRLCAEDGGVNISFCEWLQEMAASEDNRDEFIVYEEWDSSGINKSNAVLDLQATKLYIDEERYPKTKKQVEDTRWKKDSDRFEIEKEPADSPHCLDSLLHAVSKQLRRDSKIYLSDW